MIRSRIGLGAACGMLLAGAWLNATAVSAAAEPVLDPLVQVSGTSPFAGCNADLGQTGIVHRDSEVESWIDVNPVDPLNMVGTFQQDRYSNGGARGLVTGVTFDGGLTWSQVVVPGLTPCSGGSMTRASDPWLSFGPTGDLHHIGLGIIPGGASFTSMLVNRSLDGGASWSAPVTLAFNGFPFFHDKESITADPTDPNLVYATWDRLNFRLNTGPAVFTRSVDGGTTWEPVRIIHDPGTANQTLATQIVVAPDGTVFAFFNEILNTWTSVPFRLAYKMSTDQGQSWLPPAGTRRAAVMWPLNAFDGESRFGVRDGGFLFDVAVDPVSGRLYAVWQDGGFSGFLYPQIVLTMSDDGGATWSPPVPINRTPLVASGLNRQAFLPSVHVAADGTVGVSYYDFRRNDPEPGMATDVWFAWCHPEARDCTRAGAWDREVRLTDEPFNYSVAPLARGLFLGDYVGLSASGRDFVGFFPMTHGNDRASVFFRRVALPEAADPRGAGFWGRQLRSLRTGLGRAEETEESVLGYLEDIRGVHDAFDHVTGLSDLEAVLQPPSPATMRARAARQVMALLLNLASDRLAPSIPAGGGLTSGRLAGDLATVIADPAADRAALEAAKDAAETVNEGRAPLS